MDVSSAFYPKKVFIFAVKLFMAEIRLKIDDDFLASVSGSTGITKPAQLTTEAYNLLLWAANEARSGRVLISSNADGSDAKKIVIPSLERLRPNK